MNRLETVCAIALFFGVYHLAGSVWGKEAKFYAAVAVAVLYLAVGGALSYTKKRLRLERPDVEDSLLDEESKPPWYWRLIDGFVGICFAWGPPLTMMKYSKQPLSSDTDFTGSHLLAMGLGIAVYYAIRTVVLRLALRVTSA